MQRRPVGLVVERDERREVAHADLVEVDREHRLTLLGLCEVEGDHERKREHEPADDRAHEQAVGRQRDAADDQTLGPASATAEPGHGRTQPAQ